MTLAAGVDIMGLLVPDFASLVWWAVTKDLEEKDREKFRRQLWIPPKGEVAQGPWSPESEKAAFAAFKAQVG